MASPQAFFAGIGGGFLDRKNNERDNPEFIKELLSGPTDPECFLFFGTSPLLLTVTTNAQPTPVSVAYSWSLRDLLSDKLIDIGAPNTLFLGLRSAGAPVFASLALDDKKVIAFASSHGRKRAEQGEKVVGATFADNPQFFRVAPDIDSQDAAILGLAKSLFYFHSTNLFCPKCGSPTVSAPCGTKRICKGTNPAITCKTDHFPKTEPIAIMLVIHPTKDQILLGRRYTCLAGYMEPGESAEEAACREILEESGVVVPASSVKYLCSQPWPAVAGSQIMLGLIGRASTEQIVVDKKELDEVRWFSREEVAAALALWDKKPSIQMPDDRLNTPGPHTMAFLLMKHWVSVKC